MTVIDDYLTTVEPSKRKELEHIRALAKQTVPEAEEAIVYDHPISEEMLKQIIQLRLKQIITS